MRNITIVLILLLSTVASIQAQDKKDHREKIKALKVAYITQELNMNPEVAQKFWPVYNSYECQRRDLHRREHIKIENVQTISEAKAEEMLKEYLAVEKEEYAIKKQLFSDLKKILSSQEIIKLHKLEENFNKKLLKEYRSRKENENNQQE